MAKLTETKIKALRPRDRAFKAFDAHGLYLLVPPTGNPRWRVRLPRDGKEQHLSLGTHPEVGLDEARARAAQLRLTMRASNATGTAKLAAELRGAARPHPVRLAPAGDSLERVAERWLAKQALAGKTYKRNARVIRYLVGALGATSPVDGVDKPALRDAVLGIEREHGRETAHRALNIADAIWRYAGAHGHTDRSPVEGLRSKDILRKPNERHLPAIKNPKALASLLRSIDNYAGQPVTRLALQILPHVFTRPSELRLASWSEFERDGAAPQWIVPAERTKMRRELLVPLSTQVLGLLRELEQHRRDDLLFPSLRDGRPISDNTLNLALRNLGFDTRTQHCAHGFRSTASTLLRERCGQSPAVVETQLAHKRPGVGGIYDRSEYLEQRRAMMQVWSDYLDDLRKSEPEQ